MSNDVVFVDVTPVIPVRDLRAALKRYQQLGFSVRAYGHGTGDTGTPPGVWYRCT